LARLVIASNRLILPSAADARAGGLAVAMREALRERGGIWFGWSGETEEQPADTPRITTRGRVTYAAVDLTPEEHRLYYLGHANGTLWPLFHFRLGLMEYRRDAARVYLEVNRRFAKMLAALIQPDDLVWVHDYHLIPLCQELRRLGVANRLGFFLHTPFPPAEVLIALPRHEALVEALCAYDLVGFQTDDGVRAFVGCVTELAHGIDLGNGEVTAFGRHARAAAFPVGIDTAGFAAQAEHASDSPETRRLDESLGGRKLIFGVDRLDYSKGIPQRFEAIDALLSDWPEHRAKFSYLQITPYSRGEVAQYRALRRQIEQLAGEINGRYAEFDWTPIRYVNRSFSRQTLAGFHRRARIGLVTPLRDGMNLVAKEFVAAQNPADPGVLILSRFAGAAHELRAALLVNPIDADEMAAALRRGLDMGRDERSERWRSMMEVLTRNTVSTWSSGFLAALAATPRPPGYSPRPGGPGSGSAQSAEGGPADGLLIKF
jgi:trehalose 6-phosphate synthase